MKEESQLLNTKELQPTQNLEEIKPDHPSECPQGLHLPLPQIRKNKVLFCWGFVGSGIVCFRITTGNVQSLLLALDSGISSEGT